jgi:hypothetical protein
MRHAPQDRIVRREIAQEIADAARGFEGALTVRIVLAILWSSAPGFAGPAAHETFLYSAAASSAPRSIIPWCE